MKKAPKTIGKKKLTKEFTLVSPEKSTKRDVQRVLRFYDENECQKSDGWKQVDCIIAQLPNGNWHVRARWGQYKK